MHVAVHDDALAALLHHGGLRDAHRDRVGFALAHRAGRGDVHHEIARPRVHLVREAPRRVHLDGALRVIGRPPRTGDQHQQEEQRDQ
ncbi:hypothetical protein G6F57_023396 [Rhizopus arrhizus]|nr:hypothetical protein G6F57_023396 [Rhizopus arrhizus]